MESSSKLQRASLSPVLKKLQFKAAIDHYNLSNYYKTITLKTTMLLLAALLAFEIAGFIAWAKHVRQRPALRKKLKDNAFFWTQFWLHPVIVAGFVYVSGRTENPLWALALAPFVRAAKGQGWHPFTRVYPSRVRVKGAQSGRRVRVRVGWKTRQG